MGPEEVEANDMLLIFSRIDHRPLNQYRSPFFCYLHEYSQPYSYKNEGPDIHDRCVLHTSIAKWMSKTNERWSAQNCCQNNQLRN